MIKMYRNRRLEKVYGLRVGSCVVCNNSAYMDDATWLQVVKMVAPAVHQIPNIIAHLDWWVCLTYDRFKSHVNMSEALDVL